MSPNLANTPQWPPADGLSTVRVPKSDIILTTTASCHISAPASVVWSVLRNTSQYPDWNTFCPKATIRAQPEDIDDGDKDLHRGTHFTLDAVMDERKPNKVSETQLWVTDMSTPEQQSSYVPKELVESNEGFTADLSKVYRLSWSVEGLFSSMGLRTERFHEIIILSENESEVRTWECQAGFPARTVKWMFKATLERKFDEWCLGLKNESEKQFQAKS